MKTNGKHEVIARIAGQSLVLTALLALVLTTASISCAQSSATSSATPAAKTVAAPAKAPASTPAKPAAKGSHEGITVHGHWTLEVRNPDGSVAKHVEFENSLVTPTNYPLASMTGSQALVALLSGSTSLETQNLTSPWLIDLESLNSGDVSPCGLQPNAIWSSSITGMPGSNSASFACTIVAAFTPPANSTVATLSNSGNVNTSSLPSQLTISGTTAPAAQQGTIDTVVTLLVVNNRANSNLPFTFPFTSANLPAQGSGTCGGANQPPCAVGVSAGQTVSANVTISFP